MAFVRRIATCVSQPRSLACSRSCSALRCCRIRQCTTPRAAQCLPCPACSRGGALSDGGSSLRIGDRYGMHNTRNRRGGRSLSLTSASMQLLRSSRARGQSPACARHLARNARHSVVVEPAVAVGPPSAWSHSAIAAAAPSAPRICSAAASVSIGAGGSTPQVELECQAAGARLAGHAAGQPAGCPQLAHRPRAGWCSPAINGNFSIPNNAGTAVLPLDIVGISQARSTAVHTFATQMAHGAQAVIKALPSRL